MPDPIAKIAKAVAAAVAPWILQGLHAAGLIEVSATGVETALFSGLSAGAAWLFPNRK